MVPTRVPSASTVLTYTECRVPPKGFEPPVVLALVQMRYAGKLLCAARDASWLEIGKKVSIVPEGRLFYIKPLTPLDWAKQTLEHPVSRVSFYFKSKFMRGDE